MSPSIYLPLPFTASKMPAVVRMVISQQNYSFFPESRLSSVAILWFLNKSSSIVEAHHTSVKAYCSSEKVQGVCGKGHLLNAKLWHSLKLKDRRICWCIVSMQFIVEIDLFI